MRKLAVVNMKGGVGKTTTAVHVAAGLARAGRRVLLVDADPQGNVGHVFGVAGGHTIRELMLGEASAEDCVVRDVRPNLDVLTSSPAAFALDARLASEMQRETILTRRLRGLSGYDAVVVDSSPSMTLLTYNALLFSDEIVIPVSMDSLAITGARQTLDGIAEIRSLWPERAMTLRAVVPTSLSAQTHASRAALAALEADEDMAPAVFARGIRQCLDLTYAAAARQTIWEYAPRSRGAEDYAALVRFIDPGITQAAGEVRTDGEENAAVL
jgi:chromosome partitioning protein